MCLIKPYKYDHWCNHCFRDLYSAVECPRRAESLPKLSEEKGSSGSAGPIPSAKWMEALAGMHCQTVGNPRYCQSMVQLVKEIVFSKQNDNDKIVMNEEINTIMIINQYRSFSSFYQYTSQNSSKANYPDHSVMYYRVMVYLTMHFLFICTVYYANFHGSRYWCTEDFFAMERLSCWLAAYPQGSCLLVPMLQ